MASNFDRKEFVGNPSALELKDVTKEHLKYIARSFGINLTHDIRKDALMSLALVHLRETEQTRV